MKAQDGIVPVLYQISVTMSRLLPQLSPDHPHDAAQGYGGEPRLVLAFGVAVLAG